jgi:acetyl-CoA synthetase
MIETSRFIWEPSREFIESTNVYRFMQRLGIATYQDFIRYSQEYLEEFWDEMVRELAIEWFEPYTQVLDASRGVEWARWFTGGKLNIAWNCLDRHANGTARDRLAVIWEGEDGSIRTLTFGELRRETDRLANALRALDLAPGDRVALYMPMVRKRS